MMKILDWLYQRRNDQHGMFVAVDHDMPVHPGRIDERNALRLRICLPKGAWMTRIYCCIMHHPLRSAWNSMWDHSVDRIDIVYNGPMKREYRYTTQTDNVIITRTCVPVLRQKKARKVSIAARWDTRVAYYLPIMDATEGFEFVLSRKPIDAGAYLEGYRQIAEKVYLCEADLRMRDEALLSFLDF